MECHSESQFLDPIQLIVNYLAAETCAENEKESEFENQNWEKQDGKKPRKKDMIFVSYVVMVLHSFV